ncbi:MAG: hypothetical protein R3D44_17550 [Hyphomicrobiaceae bacterium]
MLRLMQNSMAERSAHPIAVLAEQNVDLGLDASQLSAWSSFVQEVRAIADRHRARVSELERSILIKVTSFPEQIAARLALARANSDALQELQEAVGGLYASLSLPQQDLADRMLARAFWEISQPYPQFRIASPRLREALPEDVSSTPATH